MGRHEYLIYKLQGELSVLDSTLEKPTTGERIKMYATTWCGDCRFAKRWFDAHGIPYEFINIEEDEQAADLVIKVNRGARSVPTILFPDGSILVEPSARELAAKFAR
jgi:mycoredoxin